MSSELEHTHAPAWHWLLPALLLVIIRFNIPAISGETYLVHNTIAQSILDGNKWGLMALVKIPDVPLVPTLALLAFKWLLQSLPFSPAALLCAVVQAAVILMLINAVPRKLAITPYAALAILALFTIPLFKSLALVNDPNCVSALPLAGALLNIRKYDEAPNLKNAFVIALCIGVLVFCGPVMLAVALALLAVCAAAVIRRGAPKGTLCILLMPALYALVLWFPWYSPAEDNIITETILAFENSPDRIFACPFPLLVFATLLVVLIRLAFAPAGRPALLPRCLIPAVALIPLISAVSNGLGLTQAGVAPALTVITIVVFIALIERLHATPLRFASAALILAFIAAIALAGESYDGQSVDRVTPDVIAQNTPEPPDIFNYDDAPAADKLAALADEQWLGSHIVIAGKRLVETVYPDPAQLRFKPMREFSAERFRELAKSEQLHLLVPPPDGRFYDADSPLAAIHKAGAEYLFPVAQLPGGWQLWRAIPAPLPPQPTPWHKPH